MYLKQKLNSFIQYCPQWSTRIICCFYQPRFCHQRELSHNKIIKSHMKFMRIKLTTDKLKYLISVRLKTCLIKYIHLVLTLGKGDSILLQQGRKKKVLPIHLFFILLKAFIFKFIFFFSNICNLSQFLQINFFLQNSITLFLLAYCFVSS